MSDKIIAALKKLDPQNDEHWTSEGLPRIETVRLFASDFSISRDAVNAALPGFSRTTLEPVVAAPVVPTPIVPPTEGSNEAPVSDQAARVATQEGEQDGSQAGAREALESAQSRLAAAQKAKAEADKALAEIAAEVDALIVVNEGAPESFQDHFAAYIAQQDALLRARAVRAKELQEAGIKLSDVFPQKARLDQAFQARRGRGFNRPDFPLLKK